MNDNNDDILRMNRRFTEIEENNNKTFKQMRNPCDNIKEQFQQWTSGIAPDISTAINDLKKQFSQENAKEASRKSSSEISGSCCVEITTASIPTGLSSS